MINYLGSQPNAHPRIRIGRAWAAVTADRRAVLIIDDDPDMRRPCARCGPMQRDDRREKLLRFITKDRKGGDMTEWPAALGEQIFGHGSVYPVQPTTAAGCAMPPRGLPSRTSPHRTAWSSGKARELGTDSQRRMSMRSWPVLASSWNAVRP